MLALASFAIVASQVFVPSINSPSDVNVTNPGHTAVIVTVEVFSGAPGEIRRLILAPGETAKTSSGAGRFTALSIASDGPIDVAAAAPVLDGDRQTTDGALRLGTSQDDWTSGVAVVNADGDGATMSVAVHGGGRIVETRTVYVPGRATRVLDDLSGEWLSFTASRPVLLLRYDVNGRSGAQVFGAATPSRRRAVRQAPPAAPMPAQQTVVLTPSKDNTLFESSNGTLSNGAGIHLFAGLTAQPGRRRALLAFDIASQIPPGSRITRASLAMNISMSISGPLPMRLHRATADWGEGASNAGSSRDGDGAPARANDATWIHTFSPNARWTNAGGDFAPAADATASAGSAEVTWQSSPEMVARVQDWLDRSTSNFGWIIIGAEDTARSAKRLDSREIGGATRPMLTIEFSR